MSLLSVLLLGTLLGAPELRRPVAYAERPLTLRENVYAIGFEGQFSRIGPKTDAGYLEANAAWGYADDLELRFRVVSLVLSKDPSAGLLPMQFGAVYQLVDGVVGAYAGGFVGLSFIDASQFEAGLRAAAMLRLAPLRLDLKAEAAYAKQSRAEADLELHLNLTPAFALFATAGLQALRLGKPELELRYGGGLAFTFQKAGSAVAELRAFVEPKPVALLDAPKPPFVYGRQWEAGLRLVFFIEVASDYHHDFEF